MSPGISVEALRVAVIGAATAEATGLRVALAEAGVPGTQVDLFGTTEGEVVLADYAGEARLIQEPDPDIIATHDVVFVCETGEVGRRAAARSRKKLRCARKSATPLATSTPVLKAVAWIGSRGCPGGGQTTAPARTIENAERRPAKSISSVNTKISMPITALGTSGVRSDSEARRRRALRGVGMRRTSRRETSPAPAAGPGNQTSSRPEPPGRRTQLPLQSSDSALRARCR